MGKKTPKIPDPAKALPFPGLSTGAFTLQRATPARTITRGGPTIDQGFPARGFNPNDFTDAELDRRFNAFVQGGSVAGPGGPVTTTEPASGPFTLSRTDQSVPLGEAGLLGQTQRLTPEVRSLRPAFSSLFGQSRERLEGLLAEVAPAGGRITDARVAAIDRNRSRTIGNLREAFGKRNVLGSSFAQAEIRRADQDFAQLESEARAEAAVQEIDLSREIIGNIANLDAQTFGLLSESLQLELGTIAREQSIIAQRTQRELEELRISGGIITQHSQIAATQAANQAALAGQAAADGGSFFGSLLGFGASLALGGVFGPAGAAAGAGAGAGAAAGFSPNLGVF